MINIRLSFLTLVIGVVTDICMDKEPDGVVVYANGDSCNPNQENVSEPLLDSVSRDDAHVHTELRYGEDNIEVNEYDVKECTSEIPVGKPIGDDFESKDVTKSSLHAKHASKSGRGNNKTRNTVPQPFSLATEKRASSTRSFTSESLESAGLKKFPDGHSKVQSQATKVRIYAIVTCCTLSNVCSYSNSNA